MKILGQLISVPQVVQRADAVASETLPAFAHEDDIRFGKKSVLLVVPLRLKIEIARQVREALSFREQRKQFSSLFVLTRCGRNVEELEGRKLSEERPVGTQVRDKCLKTFVFRIDVSEGDHRHELGWRIGNTERETVGESDASAVFFRWEKQILQCLESSNEVFPLGFCGLEIVVFRVSEDVIERQESRFDVAKFMTSPISEFAFSNRVIDRTRVQVIDKAPPPVSLGADMAQSEQFLDEAGVTLATLGASEVEELPHREVAGMRRHKVEESSLHIGVAETAKVNELGFLYAHGSQTVDRGCEFALVPDTPQTTGFLGPGINLEAGTGLLRKPTWAVVVRR